MTQLSKFSWIWRIVTFGFALYGIGLQLLPNQFYNLSYYTVLSNILVAGFIIYLLNLMYKKDTKKLLSAKVLRLKASVTMSILLTFIVYTVLLAPIAAPEDFYNWKNYTLHYLVPIMFFIDWLMFDTRGVYYRLDPLRWTIVPIIYMMGALIKGYIFNIPIPEQSHSPYPYFFMDINQLGWGGFFQYAVVIFIAYMVLGYGLYAIKMIKRS